MEREPSSIEEAVGLIAISKSFRNKSERLIRRILRSHIHEGSTEYRQITEDAISDVSTNMFEMAANGPIDKPWYRLGLETYGTAQCAITRYMYKGIGNYARTRFKRWSINQDTGKVAVRAREIYSVGFDDSENEISFDEWLTAKLGDRNNSDIETDATQPSLTEILKSESIAEDVIEMILLRCEGNTNEEIGKLFGLSEDAVRMRLKRVRAALADSPFLRD